MEDRQVLKEITFERFPNLAKDITVQIQEAKETTHKINPKKPTPRYTLVKLGKIKDKFRGKAIVQPVIQLPLSLLP